MSVLEEKAGSGQGRTSAGRVIAIGAAIVYGWRLVLVTIMATPIGWPDAFMFFAALVAVPLHKWASRDPKLTRDVVLGLLQRSGHGAVAQSGGNAGMVASAAEADREPEREGNEP